MSDIISRSANNEPTCESCKYFRDIGGELVCAEDSPKTAFITVVPGTPGKNPTPAVVQKISGFPPAMAHWGCGKHKPKLIIH